MNQRIDNRTKRRDPPARTSTFTAFGLAAEAKPLLPGLYVVATPIGNLQDVSFRGLSVLAAADAILAEDTRVTKTLLAHYGITTPLVAYHEHSNDAVRERMVHRVSCCSRVRTACPRCWQTPQRCSASGRPWWRAN
jgi:16S rRNA (cytidine1402-2'-O)-methyltransferase